MGFKQKFQLNNHAINFDYKSVPDRKYNEIRTILNRKFGTEINRKTCAMNSFLSLFVMKCKCNDCNFMS